MSINANPASTRTARRRRDRGKSNHLSSGTRKVLFHALLVATATVAANAQSFSAQGGMYYPYGSVQGPLYG